MMTGWTTFLVVVGVTALVDKLFVIIDWIEGEHKHEQ